MSGAVSGAQSHAEDGGSGAKPPVAAMVEAYMTGIIMVRVVPAVAELGVADLLESGPRTIVELAEATGVDKDALRRILRMLASVGVFAEDGDGAYVNTPLSETFSRNFPLSVRDWLRTGSGEGFSRAADVFHRAIRAPATPAFQLAHGMPVWEYLSAHPDEAAIFVGAMTSASSVEADAVAAAYEFAGVETLVDVGGSEGVLLAAILRANNSLRGVLFDIPVMLETAPDVLAARGLTDRCTVTSGDFFKSVPAADAHILKNILHDWDDEHCVAILRNCRRAVSDGGRLLVVQEALPPGNAPSPGKLLDFFMLLVGGRERTESEYRALYDQADYELTRLIPTATPLHIIEGIAR
jgi:hypothetical protein